MRNGPRTPLLPVLLLSLTLPWPTVSADTPSSPAEDARPRAPATFSERIDATAVTVTIDVRDATGAIPDSIALDDLIVLEDGEPRPILAIERAAPAGPKRTPSAPVSPSESESVPPVPRPLPAIALPAASGPGPAGADAVAEASFGASTDPWQLVVYFDSPTTTLPAFRDAARSLAAHAGELAALGTVELVIAAPSPRRLAGPTRDAKRLETTLESLAESGLGSNEIAQMRREFVAATDADGMENLLGPTRIPERVQGSGAGNASEGILYRNAGARSDDSGVRSGVSGQRRQLLIRSTAEREFQLLARQRTLLLDWLARVERPQRPRALVLISDGFDLDPTDFYLSYLRDATLASSVRADLEELRSSAPFEQMAQTLAAAGWQAIAVSLGQPGAQSATAADASGRGRYRSFVTDKNPQTSQSALAGFLLRAPIEPLRTLVEETGGDLALSAAQVGDGLRALGERFRLTYQVARTPDGALHSLEVRARREGWSVRAPSAVSGATPDAIMAARARHALALGDAEGSGFALRGEVQRRSDPSQPEAEVLVLRYDADLTSLRGEVDAIDAGDLRVTYAVELPDGRLFVSRSRPTARDLSSDFHYVALEPLRVPKGTRRLAVAIDHVVTGDWSATRLEIEP